MVVVMLMAMLMFKIKVSKSSAIDIYSFVNHLWWTRMYLQKYYLYCHFKSSCTDCHWFDCSRKHWHISDNRHLFLIKETQHTTQALQCYLVCLIHSLQCVSGWLWSTELQTKWLGSVVVEMVTEPPLSCFIINDFFLIKPLIWLLLVWISILPFCNLQTAVQPFCWCPVGSIITRTKCWMSEASIETPSTLLQSGMIWLLRMRA